MGRKIERVSKREWRNEKKEGKGGKKKDGRDEGGREEEGKGMRAE